MAEAVEAVEVADGRTKTGARKGVRKVPGRAGGDQVLSSESGPGVVLNVPPPPFTKRFRFESARVGGCIYPGLNVMGEKGLGFA